MTAPVKAWSSQAEALWRLVEAYHAVTYFAPEVRQACDEAGLRGGWMAYFACRAAPLGAIGPAPVAAMFFNFAPRMVERSLPDAWAYSSPDGVLRARWEGVGRALERLLGDTARDDDAAQAARWAALGVSRADPAGRPLFAANAALAGPEEPHVHLWQATTGLREHRGDGHVAVLTAEGIDGCEAHVLQAATGRAPREVLQPNRGWTDDEWAAATHRLVERGLVTRGGDATDAGRGLRQLIEAKTNALAGEPYAAVGREVVERLAGALDRLVSKMHAAGPIPYPNPMGLPPPVP